jgi:hypothetical protein
MANLGTVRSITQVGKYEPFELQVARGQITGHESVFQFGQAPTVTTQQTLWVGSGVYAFPSAATVMKVSSSSANDAAAGTGARTVNVVGLDASYNEISETVTLNGQTAVNTVNSFLRINDFYVLTAGSGNTAAGTLYVGVGTVTTGVPATVYSQIQTAYNAQSQAVYTVPAGYTAYVSSYTFTSNCGTANVTQSGFLFVYYNASLIPSIEATARFNAGSSFDRHFDYPLAIPEKSDLDMRAVSATSSQMTGEIHFILVKNNITGSNGYQNV